MRSRIIVAVGAALAVLFATAMLHGATEAEATQGQPVLAGLTNLEQSGTLLCLNDTDLCGTAGEVALEANSLVDHGIGMVGAGEIGVEGNARGNSPGVLGQGQSGGGTGVAGNGTYAVHGASEDGWGVWGQGADRGVYGISDNEGVVGFSNNVGIRAESPNIALRVKGKAEFSRSGTVTISYPNKQATVTGVPVTAKSLAFATLQQFLAGRYVVAAVPNLGGSSNSFTIYLNKAPGSSSTPKSVVVAWQVFEKA